MIRQLAILAVAAVCLAASTRAEAVTPEQHKTLNRLLLNVHEDSESGCVVSHPCSSEQPGTGPWEDAIWKFCQRYKSGMLPRGRLFSLFYPYQLEEVVLIFDVLYFAPTFTDFINFACWARLRVNEHQYIYALNMALIHRQDTSGGLRPQPYQIYPEHFFNSDVMKQMYDAKTTGRMLIPGYVIPANYTNWYITETPNREFNLTYFTEDIGLNSWYLNFHQRFPFWMSSERYPRVNLERRGEFYAYIHKILVNRFNMERLSHDLGEVEFLNWEQPIPIGYAPYMLHSNGIHFPERPDWRSIPHTKNKYLQSLRDYESRISVVVDSGVCLIKDGQMKSIRTADGFINELGNLIQGNNDSFNLPFYGSVDGYGRYILGFSPEPHNEYQVLPSALELFSTSLRDPGFYRLYNKINRFFFNYQKHLGEYTYKELSFKGVELVSADILEERLITYFEPIDVHLPDRGATTGSAPVIVRQHRLNHKSFVYNMTIQSSRNVQASIRIFIGPKYNIYGKRIPENYRNFVMLDHFVYNLTKGTQNIEHKSSDSCWASPDLPRYENWETTVERHEEYDSPRFGFPDHMILPRGKPEGMPFQFFVYVSEFVQPKRPSPKPFACAFDNKPLGYPLDRPMYNFNMDNMYLFDVDIFHKTEPETNLTTE